MTFARPKDQRVAANSRYVRRRASAGIVKITAMVPADRIPELRGIRSNRVGRPRCCCTEINRHPTRSCKSTLSAGDPRMQLPLEAFTTRRRGILAARAPAGSRCATTAPGRDRTCPRAPVYRHGARSLHAKPCADRPTCMVMFATCYTALAQPIDLRTPPPTPSARRLAPDAPRSTVAPGLALPATSSPMAGVALPSPGPPVTHVLLPGHWQLEGARYVWVPPETTLRRVQPSSFVEGDTSGTAAIGTGCLHTSTMTEKRDAKSLRGGRFTSEAVARRHRALAPTDPEGGVLAYHKGTTALCPYRSLNGRGSLLKRGHKSWRLRPQHSLESGEGGTGPGIQPSAPPVAVVIAPSLSGAADTYDRQKPRR